MASAAPARSLQVAMLAAVAWRLPGSSHVITHKCSYAPAYHSWQPPCRYSGDVHAGSASSLTMCALQNGAAVNVPAYAPQSAVVAVPSAAPSGAYVSVVASFVATDPTV